MRKSTFLLLLFTVGLSTPVMAVSCKSFKTQAQAQKYYQAKKAGWKKLDRDRDGYACDCNAGGNGKRCPNKKKKR